MTDSGGLYVVVVNAQGQHSLWAAGQPSPPGWTPVTAPADRTTALERVADLWKDMRPFAVREDGGRVAGSEVRT